VCIYFIKILPKQREKNTILAFFQCQNLSLLERKTHKKFFLYRFELMNTKTLTLDILFHSKTKTQILFEATTKIIILVVQKLLLHLDHYSTITAPSSRSLLRLPRTPLLHFHRDIHCIYKVIISFFIMTLSLEGL